MVSPKAFRCLLVRVSFSPTATSLSSFLIQRLPAYSSRDPHFQRAGRSYTDEVPAVLPPTRSSRYPWRGSCYDGASRIATTRRQRTPSSTYVCSSKRSDRSGRRDFEATQETVTRRSFTTVSRPIDRYIRFERLIISSWTTISFTNFNLLSSGGNHHLHYGIVCRNLLQGPGSVS